MSRMSELHADLGEIHAILLSQRKVAQDTYERSKGDAFMRNRWITRIECIDDLLLEFEAAGVVWPSVTTDGRKPTNVVELNAPCKCGGDIHPEHGPWG